MGKSNKLDLSESAFTVAFLRDFNNLHWAGIYPDMFLPTQRKEAYFGYDAKLMINEPGFAEAIPFFFQFKVSEYYCDPADPLLLPPSGLFRNCYYKMEIRKAHFNVQHLIMKIIAEAYPTSTYYVASLFDSVSSFDVFNRNGTILDHSAFIYVHSCPDIEGKGQHYILLGNDPLEGYFKSKPKLVKAVHCSDAFPLLSGDHIRKWINITSKDSLDDLLNLCLRCLSKLEDKPNLEDWKLKCSELAPFEMLEVLTYLLFVYADILLLFVGKVPVDDIYQELQD